MRARWIARLAAGGATSLAFALGGCGSGGPASAARPDVHERLAIGRAWNCTDNEGCIADYARFQALAADHARPIDATSLRQSLDAIGRHEVAVIQPPFDEGELRGVLLDALGVGFLVEGLDERPIEALVTAESANPSYRESDLILIDPWVGEIQAVLLRPLGPGPYPAVVAVHGHGDDAFVYRDDYHGSEFPGRGYALLILTMRAMGIDEAEHGISRALLLDGFTLIGLRSYESLVGLTYLRSRDDVIHDRIGLIGHSGGSSTGNLTIRVMDPANPERFKAYVSDHDVDFYSSGLLEPYHCETVPALYPYHEAINDLDAAATPTLVVPYAYPFGMANIFRFFDEHLKG